MSGRTLESAAEVLEPAADASADVEGLAARRRRQAMTLGKATVAVLIERCGESDVGDHFVPPEIAESLYSRKQGVLSQYTLCTDKNATTTIIFLLRL